VHSDLADLFCSGSILLAKHITRARRSHYLFHLGDAPWFAAFQSHQCDTAILNQLQASLDFSDSVVAKVRIYQCLMWNKLFRKYHISIVLCSQSFVSFLSG